MTVEERFPVTPAQRALLDAKRRELALRQPGGGRKVPFGFSPRQEVAQIEIARGEAA
jgi:hypothetical protein